MSNGCTAKCPPLAVLPVVFVPGIMGSRLKATRGIQAGETVWDPPSGGLPRDSTRAADPKISKSEYIEPPPVPSKGDLMHFPPSERYTRNEFKNRADNEVVGLVSGAIEWSSLNAQRRRERLIGPRGHPFSSSFLAVDMGRAADFKYRLGPDILEKALARGWGGCVWEFYGGFLRWLHYHGSAAICPGATVKLEVWAHPYNWSDDNRKSAKELSKTVERAYAEAQKDWKDKKPRRQILKPVVITHSMGGLVARAYAKFYGGDSSACALIHGAMPTHGAPAAYKRMRLGFELPAKVVLGSNGAEVTAVLANSPGGLELLPNKMHKTSDGNRHWLFPTEETILGPAISFPARPLVDPYKEIYLNQADWWRLVNEDWIDPAVAIDEDGYPYWVHAKPGTFKLFSDQLAVAKKFHDDLGAHFHPNTKMFWSDDQESWDRVTITDNALGIDIASPSSKGDGTVHAGSGKFVPATVESVSRSTAPSGADLRFSHEEAFAHGAAREQVAFWLNEIVWEQVGSC